MKVAFDMIKWRIRHKVQGIAGWSFATRGMIVMSRDVCRYHEVRKPVNMSGVKVSSVHGLLVTMKSARSAFKTPSGKPWTGIVEEEIRFRRQIPLSRVPCNASNLMWLRS